MSPTMAAAEPYTPETMTAPLGEIFVVDDDPAIRNLLALLFSRRGYEVVCFADGASVLATMRTQSPTCVLLDVHIPGKSGIDILRDLNARNHPAPVFIMSGKGDIPMAVEAIKGGAIDFIEKPFRVTEVVTRVEEAVGAHRRRAMAPSDPKAQTFCFSGG